MFITRASRRDLGDVADFYRDNDWGEETDVSIGVAFIARQGPIIGALRLLEVAPQMVVVEDVVVAKDHRRNGVGGQLVQAAMNSRGGRLFLCCHDDVIPFYDRLGFAVEDFESLPEPVQGHFRATGDYPSRPGHEHYFLRAR